MFDFLNALEAAAQLAGDGDDRRAHRRRCCLLLPKFKSPQRCAIPAARCAFMVHRCAATGARPAQRNRAGAKVYSRRRKIGFDLPFFLLERAWRYLCPTGGPADWRTSETPKVINAVSHIQRDGDKIIAERQYLKKTLKLSIHAARGNFA